MPKKTKERFPPPPGTPSRRVGMVSTDGGSMQPIDLDTGQPARIARSSEEPVFEDEGVPLSEFAKGYKN
jgi:hypothetical protein